MSEQVVAEDKLAAKDATMPTNFMRLLHAVTDPTAAIVFHKASSPGPNGVCVG